MLPQRVPREVLSEPAGKAVKMLDEVPVMVLMEIEQDGLVFV
jgi:hypothetical protein